MLCIFSCDKGNTMSEKENFQSINKVSEATWQKLSQKKIYFGHQSVGFNIFEGVKDAIKENPQIKLKLSS